MKNRFFTGLILILPLTITIIIVMFLINLLTNPFLGVVSNILIHYGLVSESSPTLAAHLSKVFILLFLFCFTLLFGFLGRIYLQHHLIELTNLIFHRIPLVNRIYKICQEIVHTLFTPQSKNFQKVVMVPFPSQASRSIGLISCDQLAPGSDEKLADYVAVLVPGTPNPTVGLILLYKKEQLVHIDIKPEDALKCIVSCGIIYPTKTSPNEN